ncbi:MAG TPA: hypothetical protein VJ728_13385 [Candidatus Binataceae bacterium]|nr:hypothetical protein [Candidatus Binataceae bacterium]
MANSKNEEGQTTPSLPPPDLGDEVESGSTGGSAQKPESGVRLMTILYSSAHDLYRVPSINKPCWLSVRVYDLPATQLPADVIYLGPAMTADGKHWRKAYAMTWRAIIAGEHATLPADDAMVIDYLAATFGIAT